MPFDFVTAAPVTAARACSYAEIQGEQTKACGGTGQKPKDLFLLHGAQYLGWTGLVLLKFEIRAALLDLSRPESSLLGHDCQVQARLAEFPTATQRDQFAAFWQPNFRPHELPVAGTLGGPPVPGRRLVCGRVRL